MKLRTKHIKVDTRDTHKEACMIVEESLNEHSRKIYSMGGMIVGEEIYPSSNSTKSFFTLRYDIEPKVKQLVQYKYNVYNIIDVADSAISNMENEEIINLEKKGNDVLRLMHFPKLNTAYTQLLIAYVKKEVEKNEQK